MHPHPAIVRALSLLVLGFSALQAAPIDGRWAAEFDTQIGLQKYVYTLAADGDRLTGSAIWERAGEKGEVALTEGKLSGDRVSFVETISFQDMQLRIKYSGTLAGDELRLTREVSEFATEQIVAKRLTAAAVDPALQKRIDAKAAGLLGVLRLEDAAKAARAKAILGEWLVTMWSWHAQNDPQLKELWSQWNQARAVVPKDEFPAEVIAHRIDDVYASLRPAYQAFIDKLAAELTAEQIDAFKETWSRSPGMKRTYQAYLEIVPDLNEEQKKVIHDRMILAREDAMLTDADKEIAAIYKRHKVKVEAYVGSLEWAKLHRAFANRGKAPSEPAAQK